VSATNNAEAARLGWADLNEIFLPFARAVLIKQRAKPDWLYLSIPPECRPSRPCSYLPTPPISHRKQYIPMTSAEGTVSGEEMARWLGLSGKEVYDLAKANILVRVGRSYRLEESVRRYCDYLRRLEARMP
jgi:hypothetical protein